MEKVNHIVITRFLSRQFRDIDVLSEDVIDERLEYLVKNTIQTLNNQTISDFEFLLLVNPGVDDSTIRKIQDKINSKGRLKYKVSIMPHENNAYYSYIESKWNLCKYLVLSRIDDDDFVTKNAVSDVRDLICRNPDFDILACGYKYGYKLTEGMSEIGIYESPLENGHIAIFQTLMYNTSKIKFNKAILPYSLNHTDIAGGLEAAGCRFQLVHFDRKDAFIYFRHKSADSYNWTLKNSRVVQITDSMKTSLKDEFGIEL